MNIIGQEFLVDFGMAKAILNFQSEALLTFTIIHKDGQEINFTETVNINLTQIRPQLYIATWQEANGNTVTQIQDYDNRKVYSNWTLLGGEFINKQGTLNPV